MKKRIFKGIFVVLVLIIAMVMLNGSNTLIKVKEQVVDLNKKEELTPVEQEFVNSLSLEVIQEYNYPDTN
ncbi:hypothetical protein J7L48_07950, partial [bacterium]|nr:hypothetical protein [bacterium]